MTATIFICREPAGIMHEFAVTVSRDSDGDIESKVSHNVPQKGWTRKWGDPQICLTGYNLYREGQEIELEEWEIVKANKALDQLEAGLHQGNKELFKTQQ